MTRHLRGFSVRRQNRKLVGTVPIADFAKKKEETVKHKDIEAGFEIQATMGSVGQHKNGGGNAILWKQAQQEVRQPALHSLTIYT